MSICYILYSHSLDRYYIGVSQEGIAERLAKHNSHYYGTTRFTATANDWEVYLVIDCNDFSQAVRIERHLKKMKSRTYLLNLKKYPEMLKKLMEK